jgi:REP element-mobilizing transposase RayT
MHNTRFRNRYRINTTRLSTWDYGCPGTYFVTICTKYRDHAFGKVIDHRMVLNMLGQVAWDCWNAIPAHHPYVCLDAFVAMPDHVHGLLTIHPHENIPQTPTRFGPQSRNLASIVRGFKSGVTVAAQRNNIPFRWQERYHDSIIRNSTHIDNVKRYILNNPLHFKTNHHARSDDIHHAGIIAADHR